MMAKGILIIEDEVVLAKKIAKYLGQNGYETRVVGNGKDGLKQLESFHPEVVLLDFNLPGGLNGLEVLKRIRFYDSNIKVILVTGQGDIQLAVEAMKTGAYDYLSKPVMLSGLKTLLEHAVGKDKQENLLSYYQGRETTQVGIEKIVGRCEAIYKIKQQIKRVLDAGRRLTVGSPPPVLITGETGTGKELVARAIHYGGVRSEAPFTELNLAGFPSHLVESELFGFERGAFTDARERKLGLVESANGGTLFLDEIGELPQSIQVKLLKLLEGYEVRRLGSLTSQKIDLQIVSATNCSLENMVKDGLFRSDLLFRLNTVCLELPPLRERGGDIVLLARHFAKLFGEKYGLQNIVLSEQAEAAIERYHWPGNVRELRNKMEQAVMLCDGQVIAPNHLDFSSNDALASRSSSASTTSFQRRTGDLVKETPFRPKKEEESGSTLEVAERDLVNQALLDVGGNVSKAARRLGISRHQMRYRIEKYGLSDDK